MVASLDERRPLWLGGTVRTEEDMRLFFDNNKIRVIQRRAYGIKDQEYLRLKVITLFIKDSC